MRRHYFILLYGVANWLIILIYLVWVINNFDLNILYFPLKIYHAVIGLFSLDTAQFLELLSFNSILLITFYIIIIKFTLIFIRRVLTLSKPKPDLKRVDQER